MELRINSSLPGVEAFLAPSGFIDSGYFVCKFIIESSHLPGTDSSDLQWTRPSPGADQLLHSSVPRRFTPAGNKDPVPAVGHTGMSPLQLILHGGCSHRAVMAHSAIL